MFLKQNRYWFVAKNKTNILSLDLCSKSMICTFPPKQFFFFFFVFVFVFLLFNIRWKAKKSAYRVSACRRAHKTSMAAEKKRDRKTNNPERQNEREKQ